MRYGSNQSGQMNVLLIPLILLMILFIGAGSAAAWAYMSRQDYKYNADQKAAVAAEQARKEEAIKKDLEHAEIEKNPFTTYKGPSAYGSVSVTYPKTWSTYVHSTTANNSLLDAYFSPRFVPSVQDQGAVYSLRIKVVQQDYVSVVKQLESSVKSGDVTAQPFAFPRVPDVVGTRVDGTITQSKKTKGIKIIMPLRDKALEIYSESPEFANDFNTIIIPNLTFSP